MKKHTLHLPTGLLFGMFVVCLLSGIRANAQVRQITGTVLSKSGSSILSGVTVNIKGTSTNVTTNNDGRFTISASTGDVLEISFVGYLSQDVRIEANTTDLSVQLTENYGSLDDVVVIGYGAQKKKLVTGANLQIKGADIQKQSTTNALQALQGQAPGVQITTTSGQPGSGMNVIIRGKGTIGNFGPLYVVDGINTTDISYLNPADIESIDVLKDAASAAIYGSQAANGVVLVTTRTGKTNLKPQITYDGFFGIQNAPKKPHLLNSKEYGIIMNEAAVNSGKAPYFTADELNNFPTDTRWLDEMFVKNAPTQNHSVGITGGGGSSSYSTSLAYTGQEGIVGGKALSNYERYTFRINSEHGLYKNVIKMGQHLTFTYDKNNGIAVDNIYNNTLRSAFGISPFLPMYDENGNFFDNSNSTWNNAEANPYAEMSYRNQNRKNNQRLFGDVYLVVEPIKNLRFRSVLGINQVSREERSFLPQYKLSIYAFNDFTTATQLMGRDMSLQFDNFVSYNFNVARSHSFEVMAGTSAIRNSGSDIFGRNRELIFADLRHAWLSNAANRDGANITLTGKPYEDVLNSYFGRIQYNLNETYLFNFTMRADGSSKFAPGNRWGYFPSVSAGWVMSNESFLRNAGWLSFLKMRASWGRVGNQNVDGFQFLTPITFAYTNYSFGPEEGVLTPGAYPSRLGNPNVSWETSEQTNVGIDATINKRFNINVDFYIKDTKDWLITAPVLATAGADAPVINGGDVRNSGVEVGLSYAGKIGDLNYNVSANGAYNKNRIGNIPTLDNIIHGNTNTLYNNSLEFYRAQNGFPVGYFWGLKTDGLFQTEADLVAHSKDGSRIQPSASPGDVRYVDLNNDGVINDNDRTMIGNPNPDFTFGFSVSAQYKGFDLSILASGVAGNELVQSWRDNSSTKANYSSAILDRWHGPGSSNRIPRVTEDNRNWTQFSDLYIHKGDFLRLSNVTIGYDLSRLTRKPYLSKVRLYAAALNLITFTSYNGMDPEIGYGEEFSSGVDLGYYPRPRTFMIGANIKF